MVPGSARNWIAVNAFKNPTSTKNMTTLHLGKSIGRSPLRYGLFLTALVLACLALSPQARAVCQEGCLTNENTVLGDDALLSNTTGFGNTATGFQALLSNTAGGDNTANGVDALFSNTTGGGNTAVGAEALSSNTTGIQNTALGDLALDSNTTGSSNVAIGSHAGFNLTTGSNNIDIGNPGIATEAGIIRIGTVGTQTSTFIAGVSVSAIAGGAVVVNNKGRLGVASSSQRFKDQIKPMEKASEAVLALRPVTFRYKPEVDPERAPQFGLVAEDVEKVNPDLVARDEQGKPYTVRYEAVNAMLLNEFLKEHRTVQEQEATIAQLKAAVAKQEATTAHQQKQIAALTAGLQKVSAQLAAASPSSGGLETTKFATGRIGGGGPAPQVVNNP